MRIHILRVTELMTHISSTAVSSYLDDSITYGIPTSRSDSTYGHLLSHPIDLHVVFTRVDDTSTSVCATPLGSSVNRITLTITLHYSEEELILLPG